jgi:transcriptional regulator with XRE-family HTH domain
MGPLGQQIDRLRREKGWNWKELARRAHMHPQTVYKIVHGQAEDPRFRALVRLALAFDTGLDTLVGPLDAYLDVLEIPEDMAQTPTPPKPPRARRTARKAVGNAT